MRFAQPHQPAYVQHTARNRLGMNSCVLCVVFCVVCCVLCVLKLALTKIMRKWFQNARAHGHAHAQEVSRRENFTNLQPNSDTSISALPVWAKNCGNGFKLASKIEGKSLKNRKKNRQEIGYQFFIDSGFDFDDFWYQNGTKLEEKPKQHLTSCVRIWNRKNI